MKRLCLSFAVILMSIVAFGQQPTKLTGAYMAKEGKINHLWLFIDGYSSYIQYEDDKYLSTWGGPFSMGEDGIVVDIEYSDANPAEVGTKKSTSAKLNGNAISSAKLTYKQLPPKAQDLDGLWRITGRQQGDKMGEIPRGDRKTIKLLVSGYFQWIAINPAERGFYGTGGGTYRFADKKYTEHIVFFSRDNSRVGADLSFDGELKDGAWHHKGLSSKGDPIYEIWSRDN
ncbi:hypothetical protein [Sphingobacterium lactis]|uniref:Membrane or secreted protein n=1 Tax=Sphingobacterium lactis TaxID=797291 RepID=A0A1H6B074_9SPHI|nr:hypothetical protein [Sphingobacterium lactis]SEG53496.1 hypothetical protein SAMN05421877_10945 [Sphingobacterium lactis]